MSDPVGNNAQLPRYRSVADSCFDTSMAHETIWANPDFALLEEFLRQFRRDYHTSPHDTSLTLVCPAWTDRRFWKLLRGARVLARYAAGSHIYTSPDWAALRMADGRYSMANLRTARGPANWDTLVIHFPRAHGRCNTVAALHPPHAAEDAAYRRALEDLPTLSGQPHNDLLILSAVPATIVPPLQPRR